MKRNITLVLLLTVVSQLNAQLPDLVDTLVAPCGGHVDYSHSPTGESDAVGFLMESGLQTCLPIEITLRHYAYTIKDRLEVCFQDQYGVWHRWYDTGWHSKLKKETVGIPTWVISIMFVSHNNHDEGTAWWLELDCEYPPLTECCRVEAEISGPFDILCPDDQIQVMAHVLDGNPPYQYFWGNSTTSGDSLFTGIVAQNFRVRVVDSIGCEGFAFFRANTRKSPIKLLPKTVCPGSWIEIPRLPNLSWQFQDTSVFLTQDTVLWGIATDSFGCEYSVPLRIFVQRPPAISPDTVVCRNQSISLHSSDANCFWQDVLGKEISHGENLFVLVGTDTSFYSHVVDSLGCLWKDSVHIETRYCLDDVDIYKPNVIMPEGANDPVNGIWRIFIDPAAYDDIQVVSLRIWDRWGSIVHEGRSLEAVWGGTYSDSRPAPAGVYIWQVRITDIKGEFTLSGDVTIIR